MALGPQGMRYHQLQGPQVHKDISFALETQKEVVIIQFISHDKNKT